MAHSQVCFDFEKLDFPASFADTLVELESATASFCNAKGGTSVQGNGSRAICLAADSGALYLHNTDGFVCTELSFVFEQETYSPVQFRIKVNGTAVDSVSFDGGKGMPGVFNYSFKGAATVSSFAVENSGGACSFDDLCFGSAAQAVFELPYKTLVISEIMADPFPVIGLPDCEYIEVYNNTDRILQLDEYMLVANDDSLPLPQFQLQAGGYAVLASAKNVSVFGDSVSCLAVPSFPALNNSGEELALIYKNGDLVDYIKYEPALHTNKVKADGGWSVENCCLASAEISLLAWKSSLSASGGTPGLPNSCNAAVCSAEEPVLTTVCYVDTNVYRLCFSQPVRLAASEDIQVQSHSVCRKQYVVYCKSQTEHSVEVIPFGREQSKQYRFEAGCPVKPQRGDLIINEILADAAEPASDFIELYNNSSYFFRAEDLKIVKYNSEDFEMMQAEPIARTCGLIPPHTYVLLNADIKALAEVYYLPDTVFAFASDLPSLPADEGIVAVCENNLQMIDSLHYTDEMHHPDVYDAKGVSLERLSFSKPAIESDNWMSAAETAGYATPGYMNSHTLRANPVNGKITVSGSSISPNNDGLNDMLAISFNGFEKGATANIAVMAANSLIEYVYSNSLISDRGVLVWDARLRDGNLISPGLYILFVEVAGNSGTLARLKYAVVVE